MKVGTRELFRAIFQLDFAGAREKRQRAAALQDADALTDAPEMREASWSAPVLWRFVGRGLAGVSARHAGGAEIASGT